MSSLRDTFRDILEGFETFTKLEDGKYPGVFVNAAPDFEMTVDALIQAVEVEKAEAYKQGYIDRGIIDLTNQTK